MLIYGSYSYDKKNKNENSREQFGKAIAANAVNGYTERFYNKAIIADTNSTLYMLIKRNDTVNKSMIYEPYKLVVTCCEFPKGIRLDLPLGPAMPNDTYNIVLISATPISSIYCGKILIYILLL